MADNNAKTNSIQGVNLDSLADNKADTSSDDEKILSQVSKMTDSNPYMQALEQNVEGAIFDDPDINEDLDRELADYNTSDEDQDYDDSEDPSIQDMSPDEVETYRQELENLKKRYESSSEEAKRLNARLKELEEYQPVIEVMRENPEIIDKIADYLEQGGNDALQPPEDFSMDEALTDQDSESARFLQAYMDRVVDNKVKARETEREKKLRLEKQKREAIEDLSITEDDIQDTIDYWKNRGLTIKDLYLLRKLPERDRKIAKNAIDAKVKQAERMRETGRSAGSVNAQRGKRTRNVDREVFDQLKKSVEGMDIFS